MITEQVRRLIETASHVFVATADSSGVPHIAIGEQVAITGNSLLVFENWFCPVTLQNIAANTHVSVVVFEPDTGSGYQLICSVARNDNAAIHGGDSAKAVPVNPEVLTRFTVKIHQVLGLSSGIHSDIPIIG